MLHDKMDKGLTFNNDIKCKEKRISCRYIKLYIKCKILQMVAHLKSFSQQEFCDKLNANDTIIVTYSATLNENAVIGETGNTNEAKLEYGDKNTISSKTITKTYKIPVFKYTKKNGTNEGLAGAIFTLSKNSNGENPIELVKITETEDIYRVAKETEAAGITKITKVTTPENGSFTIIGLDADTYYLTETKQPDGYNKLSNPVKIVIAADGKITIEIKQLIK